MSTGIWYFGFVLRFPCAVINYHGMAALVSSSVQIKYICMWCMRMYTYSILWDIAWCTYYNNYVANIVCACTHQHKSLTLLAFTWSVHAHMHTVMSCDQGNTLRSMQCFGVHCMILYVSVCMKQHESYSANDTTLWLLQTTYKGSLNHQYYKHILTHNSLKRERMGCSVCMYVLMYMYVLCVVWASKPASEREGHSFKTLSAKAQYGLFICSETATKLS